MIDNKPTFEEANENLEKIVQKMETGTLTLQQSIDEYAKACELIAYCMNELEVRRGEIIDINEKIKKIRAGEDECDV
jgi:exodeoxyribonuclease VII small subunit